MTRPFRRHQEMVSNIVRAIAGRQTDVRDILAAVTPGGGKSLLPVIAAARLIEAGVADRVCWIVPRDSLRLQAEEAFIDPVWRTALGHTLTVRAAENSPDPCRGLQGYVTTYQAVAAAPELHLAEFQRHRYLLAIDELHHLPALSDLDNLTNAADETAWSHSILPLLELSAVRLLMSGTLQRTDGKAILWLPYKQPQGARRTREIDFNAESWAIVGYSRRQALAERAVLPVTFGALDGDAEWRDPLSQQRTVESLSQSGELAHDALFTVLRTEFADALLRVAYRACRDHRAARRKTLGARPGDDVRGLGKLLVVAPDQATAWRYVESLRSRFPQDLREIMVRAAMSDVADSQEAIAEFRMRPFPAILVTVSMAYEGMDCPEITHIACLTHIRSRPWLEQMIARATRVDPHAGDYDGQSALVYHPDDPMFRSFRHQIETEQGTKARVPKRRAQHALPLDGIDRERAPAITPLHSNATALRFDTVAPGPDFGSPAPSTPADGLQAQPGLPLLEPPSIAEHRLRQRIGQMVAAQVIEDEDAHLIRRNSGYHAYNAILKRVLGKSRAEMTLAELEAAVGWLERNRLSDHSALIDNDPQYRWSSSRRGGTIRLGPHKF
ncbi:DEAD/DEAH box helicase family protein [Skermanella rosea]|uniref:DEAD/DEAH box helicase n=1 Tax=Skermanella rosea TaxID=1817965 RepID=UPI001931E76B|nr:DEAD/DEAH box helicase family protein [Skermanella rosea]UEM05816.1 DEAD/DEAH box helicase family protein [Skermanella rosea]